MHLSGRNHRGFVAALILAAVLIAPGVPAADSPAYWPRVSQLIGMPAEDRAGHEVGKLCDFAVDSRTSRSQYAIIAAGGILGIGRKLPAVPVPFVSAPTAKRDTIALNLSRAQWLSAPIISA